MPEKNGAKDPKSKEPEVVIFARYVGNGKQYFIDVDARDLTREEFDRLAPLAQRDVLAGTIYEIVGSVPKDAPVIVPDGEGDNTEEDN